LVWRLQTLVRAVPLWDVRLSVTLDEIGQHVAKRLGARRASLGLSLAEVSARCGVSLQQVHRYEVGENTISAPMLWQLSKCLDVDIHYFFEGLEPAA
jgi:transcriptional regulator with XRE-family HTH domain